MDRLKQAALLTRFLERLREQGSWCGETHIQKSTLFLQDLMKVPLGFDFIMYKHGPFSFDLRYELTALRADELIRIELQRPYGPRFAPTDHSKYIQGLSPITLGKYEDRIEFVAKQLGGKGVTELEKLATALYVTHRAETDASVDDRSRQLTKLKPRISSESARAAVEDVDRIIAEAQEYLH